MPLSPLQIVGPSYKDTSLPFSAQETINFFVETAEQQGTRNVIKLCGTPGLSLLATLGGGPIRGFGLLKEKVYVVSGTKLYRLDDDWTSEELGTVPGTRPVRMTANSYQLLIVNGTNGYVYNVVSGNFGQITDDGYYGNATTADFIDQFAVQNTSQGRFFWNDVNESGSDFTQYRAVDIEGAESDPDELVGLIVDHLEVWLLGSRRTEIWLLQPDADRTFVRQAGTLIERGCSSPYTITRLDNSVFWLGDDGIVYRANGYVPVRVSDSGIEQDIADADWSTATAFGYTDEGHKFYQLNIGGKTWVYDCKTQMWHRRKSYGIDRSRVENYIFAYGKHIVGDFENGCVYDMSRAYFQENGEPLIAERMSGFLHNNQQPVFIPYLEILVDTGTAAEYDFDPQIELMTSKDYGRTWSEPRPRSMGERGQYAKRCTWHGLGRFVNALGRVRIAGNIGRDIVACNGQIETGDTRGN